MQTPLLTGSTGYLGIHVLRVLLEDPTRHCVCLVRAASDAEAAARLGECYEWYFGIELPRHRVRVFSGDICAAALGLPAATYDRLAEDVDAVFHSAADVRQWARGREIDRTNVDGTRCVAEFAAHRRQKTLAHVSTLAVAGSKLGGEKAAFSEEDFNWGQEFVTKYERSKFEAETVVRAYGDSAGSASIYRVGNVAAHSRTGRFQRNIGGNRIYQMIKGFVSLGLAPQLHDGQVSFAHVDITAEAIVADALSVTRRACMHVANPCRVPWTTLVEGLQDYGYALQVVPDAEFVREARKAGTQAEAALVASMWVDAGGAGIGRPTLDNRASMKRLDELDIRFPVFEREWYRRSLDHAVAVGYLNQP